MLHGVADHIGLILNQHDGGYGNGLRSVRHSQPKKNPAAKKNADPAVIAAAVER